jgi:osmotically-inducible protein OsmY
MKGVSPLSSTYQPGQASIERRLAEIACEAAGVDFEHLNVSVLGRRVVLRGIAPSYMAKARAAESVRAAGFPDVENCLRVVPGMPARV